MVLKKISFLIFALLFAKHSFSQCNGCTTVVTNNSVSVYTVSPNAMLCIAQGVTYTGSIILDGGTLCNNGSVNNITFKSGVFNNYGNYSQTGNLSIEDSDITINGFANSKFSIGGNLSIECDQPTTSVIINIQNGPSVFTINGNLNCTKGSLYINPKTSSTQFSEGVFVNINGQFKISNNASLYMTILRGASFNVSKDVSFDGKYNKTISNAGNVNFNKSLNITGNGQNQGVVTISNQPKAKINITGNLNASYNNGIITVTNYGDLVIGKSWTQNRDVTNITNNYNLNIGLDCTLERGTLINNGTMQARDISLKFGTLTNNNSVQANRDFMITNSSATVNNNGLITVLREFNNKGTLNMAQKSYINTRNYVNDNNGIINGPTSAPDTLSYARLFMSGSSTNSGYVNGRILIYSATLSGNSSNVGYGFNQVSNANRIASTVIFAAVVGPTLTPVINCVLIKQLYTLTASGSPTLMCAQGPVNLTSQFNQVIPFFIITSFFPITIISTTIAIPFPISNTSYTWQPGSLIGKNQTVNPSASTNYTVSVNYLGCIFTKTVGIVISPNSVTISANQSSPLCFPSPGLTLNSVISSTGLISLQWYRNGTAIPGATGGSYSPTSPGIYQLQVTGGSCPTVISSTIGVFPKPNVTITSSGLGICNNTPVTFTATVGSGSGSGFSYQWTQNLANVGININTYIANAAGNYAVTVTNSNGCTGTSNSINIVVSANFFANAGPDQIYISTPVPIGGSPACATGGVPPYTSLWSSSSGFVTGTVNQCNNTVAPPANTIYTLTVTDASGCQATDDVLVVRQNNIISYIVPKKNVDGGYQVPVTGKVYFEFSEEYKNNTLSYKIFDYNSLTANIQPAIIPCSLNSTAKILGDNRYYIDITTCAGSLQPTKFYLVEVTNDKNEKFYFKFLN